MYVKEVSSRGILQYQQSSVDVVSSTGGETATAISSVRLLIAAGGVKVGLPKLVDGFSKEFASCSVASNMHGFIGGVDESARPLHRLLRFDNGVVVNFVVSAVNAGLGK